jgi:hypothetical protein
VGTLTALPEAFAAGTTVKYTRSFSDYPASAGWTAKLHLAGVTVLTVESDADGASFVFTLAATATADLKPGNHLWREIVEKAGEKFIAASGMVRVEPDVEAATAGSLQGWEEAQLAVVEAALAGRLTSDMESYQIAGRAIVKIPASELLKLRNQLRAAVNAQSRPGRMGPTVVVEFSGGGFS